MYSFFPRILLPLQEMLWLLIHDRDVWRVVLRLVSEILCLAFLATCPHNQDSIVVFNTEQLVRK